LDCLVAIAVGQALVIALQILVDGPDFGHSFHLARGPVVLRDAASWGRVTGV
jgi:hypothetical protein